MKEAVAVFAFALVLAACSSDDDILEIGDRFFVTQIIDIFTNPQDYLGRTVRYEGIFRAIHWPQTGNYYFAVIRYMTSCCGTEPIGLEVLLPSSMAPVADRAWVQITGVFEKSQGFPAVRATALVETPQRGSGFVERR